MSLAKQVGQGIQALRKAKHLTQARLSEQAGLTSDEISRIERGAREPRFDTLERIAKVLGVEARALFQGGGNAVKRTASKAPSSRTRLTAALEGVEPEVVDALIRCVRILSRAIDERDKRLKS